MAAKKKTDETLRLHHKTVLFSKPELETVQQAVAMEKTPLATQLRDVIMKWARNKLARAA